MSIKITHEIRDPIHVFIKLNNSERKVLDSPPLQRLRNIHQLSMSYLVYPGATHKRFEHSLGVMELATKIFDIISNEENRYENNPLSRQSPGDIFYWRKVLRMAALCHDVGHLPFSHAGEDLFPKNYNHEIMTKEIICSDHLSDIWEEMHISAKDVAKIALGPKNYPQKSINDVFSPIQNLLSEIITSDIFGADRMDYLLRDSYHSGVSYGKFDHYRLIDTMRALPKTYENPESPEDCEFSLGMEEGGLQSAESLLFARYNMFSQLYFHEIRRIYDIHLKDHLNFFLNGERFPIDVDKFLELSDIDIISSINKAAKNASDNKNPGKIINQRLHYKTLYKVLPNDRDLVDNPGQLIYDAVKDQFGKDSVRYDDKAKQTGKLRDFPVLYYNNEIVSSYSVSENLVDIPNINFCRVYIHRDLLEKGSKFIKDNKQSILHPGE